MGQAGSLGGDALEDVVDERVHDGHGLAGDASVGVNLLQNLVDVDGVGFPPPPLALLVSGTDGLRLAGGLLSAFTGWLWWHDWTLNVPVCRTKLQNETDAHRRHFLFI